MSNSYLSQCSICERWMGWDDCYKRYFVETNRVKLSAKILSRSTLGGNVASRTFVLTEAMRPITGGHGPRLTGGELSIPINE